MSRGVAWVAYGAVMTAAGWILCTVVLMQDCETLGAFRIGEVAYQCEQKGRGW